MRTEMSTKNKNFLLNLIAFLLNEWRVAAAVS
jgi:hypothetical protein